MTGWLSIDPEIRRAYPTWELEDLETGERARGDTYLQAHQQLRECVDEREGSESDGPLSNLGRLGRALSNTLGQIGDGLDDDRTTIREKVTCPACNGRGKSYGSRFCGRCHGRHTVTEKRTIEDRGGKKIVRDRVTCPACNGRGKSYGPRYCGRCQGRHVVTEKRVISR